MKKDLKIKKGVAIAEKNHYWFYAKFFKDRNFRQNMHRFINKFNPNYKKISGLETKSYKNIDVYKEFHDAWVKFLKYKNLQERDNLLLEISYLISEYKLGYEWLDTFITLIMQNKFIAPCRNFHIMIDNNRPTIILNANTSLDDIEIDWGYIKKLQERCWQDKKRINTTKDLLYKLRKEITCLFSKNNPEMFSFDDGLTPYQKAILKSKDYNEQQKQKYLKENIKGLGLKYRRNIKEKKISDRKIAKRVEGTSGQKKVNKIKQIRHRFESKSF